MHDYEGNLIGTPCVFDKPLCIFLCCYALFKTLKKFTITHVYISVYMSVDPRETQFTPFIRIQINICLWQTQLPIRIRKSILINR